MRFVILPVLLALLAACQPVSKGPGETGQPLWYDPQRAAGAGYERAQPR